MWVVTIATGEFLGHKTYNSQLTDWSYMKGNVDMISWSALMLIIFMAW